MADKDKIGGSDDEIRMLSISSIYKKSNKVVYLTSGAKKTFNHLRHIFTQAPILQHFDSKCHI